MEHVFMMPNLYSSIRLEGLQYCKVGKGWSYPNHRHANFEFLYCAEGEIEQWVNGQAYRLRAGDAMIIKSGLYHRSDNVIDHTVFFDFHFDLELRDIHSIFQMISDPVIRSRPTGGHQEQVTRWIESFISEFGPVIQRASSADKSSGMLEKLHSSVSMLRMHARFVDLISLLAEYWLSRTETEFSEMSPVHPSQMKIAHDAAYWLETNYSSGVRISELADRLNVHRSYVTSCFSKVFGMSPRDYLISVRIREAKRILRETDLTVDEISHRLSFSSPSHLCRSFRSIVGISPQQFRSRTREAYEK